MKPIKRTEILRWTAAASFAVVAFLAVATGAQAQSAMLSLPDLSQHARVMQRIGLTEISIDYHGPVARGRKIFGGLLPYGKVWRAGADYNTTIEFSDPVTVNGQPLAKGVYGVHMVPGENSWIVIFSHASQSWGSFTYDQKEDALRVNVTPQSAANQDVLTYAFSDPTLTSVTVTMRWGNVAVPFKIEVNTPAIVEASLREQLRGRPQFEWQPWEEAANYLLENKLSPDEALQWAEQSIGVEDRFENEITKARALSALGRKEEATAAHSKALGMASQGQMFGFAKTLQTFGQQDFAMEIFQLAENKDPNSFTGHDAAARIAVANQDYGTALREMKLALAVAPAGLKDQAADIVRQLQDHVDIN
jgi:hypothetical protein